MQEGSMYHSSPHDSLHHSASGPQLRTATKGSHHQIAQEHRVVKDSDQWLSGCIHSATLAILKAHILLTSTNIYSTLIKCSL